MPIIPAKKTGATEEQVFPGRYVTLAEAQSLLEGEQEARIDLTYEQKLSLDHATHFVRMPAETAAELRGKLEGLGLTPSQASKVVDLAPTHEDDVRAVFAKDRMTPEPEILKQIIELIEQNL